MKIRRHLRIIFPLFGLCLVFSAVEIFSQSAGSVTVSPSEGVAGEFGTLECDPAAFAGKAFAKVGESGFNCPTPGTWGRGRSPYAICRI